jgi:hypothetical protein
MRPDYTVAGAIKRHKTESEASLPRLDGGWDVIRYDCYAWECPGCGLVWEKRWYAETCAKRGHPLEWEQRYGGYVENGVHGGYTAYKRRAISHSKRDRSLGTPGHGPELSYTDNGDLTLTPGKCQCGSGLSRRDLSDARGIFCCYVCDSCEAEKRANYRPDIFADANYWHDEPL